ncbi:hypothetical protein AQ611_08675 [Burkholderia singularis]|nr:hypothetical protein AQ611_08675 [Burkholderia sp. Bp7605]
MPGGPADHGQTHARNRPRSANARAVSKKHVKKRPAQAAARSQRVHALRRSRTRQPASAVRHAGARAAGKPRAA